MVSVKSSTLVFASQVDMVEVAIPLVAHHLLIDNPLTLKSSINFSFSSLLLDFLIKKHLRLKIINL